MIGAASDETEVVEVDTHGAEQGADDAFVVLRTVFEDSLGGFVGIEESMEVGEEHSDFAARAEKLRDFDRSDEVGGVWAAGRCCTPVNLKGANGQNLADYVRTDYFLEIGCDEVVFLLVGEGR